MNSFHLLQMIENRAVSNLKPLFGIGSFQRTKWKCLQKLFPNRTFTIDKFPRLKKRPIKSQSKPPDSSKNCSKFLLSGLLCGTGYGLRSFTLLPGIKRAQCYSEGEITEIVTDCIDKHVPKLKWKELLKIIASEYFLLTLAIMCAVTVALINIKIPLLLGDIINVLTHCTSAINTSFIQEIQVPAQRLLRFYVAQGFWTFSYISLISKVGENIAKKMRLKLFSALLHQDIAFYDRRKTGEILERLTTDIQEFKSSFKLCLSQGIKAVTQTVGCAISLVIVSPQLSVVMLSLIPCLVTMGSVIGIELRRYSRKAQDQMAQATSVASEAINNIRTVRAFAMEPNEYKLYETESWKASRRNMRLNYGIAAFQALSNVAINGILLGVLFSGGALMSRDQLSPGDLMSFLVATQTIQKSLTQLSVLVSQAVRGSTAAARVLEYLVMKPDIPLTGGDTIPYHSLYGHVGFKDVCFNYPTRPNAQVLKNLNLDIIGGQTVALVGPSGGGKSTVAALLERFYDVNTGAVMVDGINIKDLDPSWLRGRAIGFINQEPILFNTTIMENIRYGDPTAPDVKVKEAAELANAHSFITSFPKGYGTVVGERGVTLSGGQKQRIAIARALIKQPSILILDEATSALDSESEKVVQEALDKVSKGRTVIVIAHRLSTIKNADLIAVISNGQIVESGTHDALIKKHGIYFELTKGQTNSSQKPRSPPRAPTIVPQTPTAIPETPVATPEVPAAIPQSSEPEIEPELEPELEASVENSDDQSSVIKITKGILGVPRSIWDHIRCKYDDNEGGD